MTTDLDTTETISTGLLDKKPDELTVRDNLKLTAVVVGATLAIPVALGLITGAVTTFAEVRRQKKVAKEATKAHDAIIETTCKGDAGEA